MPDNDKEIAEILQRQNNSVRYSNT